LWYGGDGRDPRPPVRGPALAGSVPEAANDVAVAPALLHPSPFETMGARIDLADDRVSRADHRSAVFSAMVSSEAERPRESLWLRTCWCRCWCGGYAATPRANALGSLWLRELELAPALRTAATGPEENGLERLAGSSTKVVDIPENESTILAMAAEEVEEEVGAAAAAEEEGEEEEGEGTSVGMEEWRPALVRGRPRPGIRPSEVGEGICRCCSPCVA
jgi:hypothetical protein